LLISFFFAFANRESRRRPGEIEIHLSRRTLAVNRWIATARMACEFASQKSTLACTLPITIARA